MYWQNRFERENPDEKLEKEILDIRKVHKDYGYRRIWGELRNRNIFINKKKSSKNCSEIEPASNLVYS